MAFMYLALLCATKVRATGPLNQFHPVAEPRQYVSEAGDSIWCEAYEVAESDRVILHPIGSRPSTLE